MHFEDADWAVALFKARIDALSLVFSAAVILLVAIQLQRRRLTVTTALRFLAHAAATIKTIDNEAIAVLRAALELEGAADLDGERALVDEQEHALFASLSQTNRSPYDSEEDLRTTFREITSENDVADDAVGQMTKLIQELHFDLRGILSMVYAFRELDSAATIERWRAGRINSVDKLIYLSTYYRERALTLLRASLSRDDLGTEMTNAFARVYRCFAHSRADDPIIYMTANELNWILTCAHVRREQVLPGFSNESVPRSDITVGIDAAAVLYASRQMLILLRLTDYKEVISVKDFQQLSVRTSQERGVLLQGSRADRVGLSATPEESAHIRPSEYWPNEATMLHYLGTAINRAGGSFENAASPEGTMRVSVSLPVH